MPDLKVRKGSSTNPDPREAIAEIHGQVFNENADITFLFVSSRYDLKTLGTEIHERFSGAIMACTTSGEIDTQGYTENGISAFSLSSPRLGVESFFIDDLQGFVTQTDHPVRRAMQTHYIAAKDRDPKDDAFGFLLIDVMSIMEEKLSSVLGSDFPQLPFAGASAGDDLEFRETHIYHQGVFHSKAAAFSIFHTSHPFQVFKKQHLNAKMNARLVITEADVEKRIVKEINGYPAAEEYARLIGFDPTELNAQVFSDHPVMIRIGGEYYIRSIQRVNEDHSFTFYCAIDEGLVLTVAESADIIDHTHNSFVDLKELLEPEVVLMCECILRRLELQGKGLTSEAEQIMQEHRAIGFHTYGEQFNGIHVNQTLTGIAIGE